MISRSSGSSGPAFSSTRSLPVDKQPGDQVTLGARAEHMTLRDDGANLVELLVGHVEYLGDQSVAYASMQGNPALLAVKQPPDGVALSAGMRIHAHLAPARCHLFDASGAAFLHPVTNQTEIETTK